ncbi:MAG: flagellar protein export ATPase FliI [Bacillota bacterium]|nr:flagellar protein export ATPase FliI [Bacillota bacterium]
MLDWDSYYNILENKNFIEFKGKVNKVVGLSIESSGPEVNVGDLCKIKTSKGFINSEVVGFNESSLVLMPLDDMTGIGTGNAVVSTKEVVRVPVGNSLLGRILDGLGNPIDDKAPICSKKFYPVHKESPPPMDRADIKDVLPLGIKAIDGLLTVGKGQRIGIFAGSGVGKSTLIGMIARNTQAEVNVVALIGERGREIKDFIKRDLGEEGLKNSVIIAATSDQPALLRLKAAFTATAIAEYFRDQGKDVLFMMDSLTRFAMAQREIGLAVGEPPVTRGYTPSVFGIMPKLLERSGNTKKGSITGIYTVLVDGDDMNEPITDAARGILDGHILLSRSLANKGHYPAIDVLGSISRVMNDIISEKHKKSAVKLRETLATYRESENLINIGAYVQGSNEKIDYSIKCIDNINNFLTQEVGENYSYENTLNNLRKVLI